jgi:small subunit ribosomal protein S20
MPNTKSAERRMRSSARRKTHNRAVVSRLKTLEAGYRALLAAGEKEKAATKLREVESAYDKAAKVGVVHAAKASRKKSRLAVGLEKAKSGK